MVASDHDRPGDQLRAFLTALAELSPVVVFAEQKSILLEVEIRAVHETVTCRAPNEQTLNIEARMERQRKTSTVLTESSRCGSSGPGP